MRYIPPGSGFAHFKIGGHTWQTNPRREEPAEESLTDEERGQLVAASMLGYSYWARLQPNTLWVSMEHSSPFFVPILDALRAE